MPTFTREQIIDRITQLLIENYDSLNIGDIEGVRKRINPDSGLITTGLSGKPVLYQYDEKAYSDELDWITNTVMPEVSNCGVETIESCIDVNDGDLWINGTPVGEDGLLTSLGTNGFWTNNISQFLTFDQTTQQFDPEQAEEILDTTIYELLQQPLTRQEQINQFFSDYGSLKGNIPIFGDYNDDGFIEPQAGYEDGHDISNDNVDDSDASITRLTEDVDDLNENQSLQWLRDDLNLYLEDIDQEVGLDDERPEYEEKSDGHLQIRHMNQAIIVRKEEGENVGLADEVPIINDGSDPCADFLDANPEYLNSANTDSLLVTSLPSYLVNGFTITQWVRFKNKVSSGTLFNFGNPLREVNPHGFMLDTFVIDEDTEGPCLDTSTNYKRYVRLVLRNGVGNLYDSHVGISDYDRVDTITLTTTSGYLEGVDPSQYTEIPVDLNEWYFIVATFNPMIDEATSLLSNDFYLQNSDYWRGNVVHTADSLIYTHHSGFGAKCKVEVISKTDLLRARGYKV